MRFLYSGAVTLALFTHAIALVVQIDIEQDESVLNQAQDSDGYLSPDAQYRMSENKGGDDFYIQDITCSGTPDVGPRVYTLRQAVGVINTGYNLIGHSINGYPHLFKPDLPAGINPACSDIQNYAVWEFPIFNPGEPNPGPDRVLFAVLRKNVNVRPMYCGLVAHTNPIDQKPSTFKTCLVTN